MKKVLTFAIILLSTCNVFSQVFSKNKKKVDHNLSVEANFGMINLWDDYETTDLLRDNVNIGIDVCITKGFGEHFYLSSGFTKSIIEEGIIELWDNPLDYFSINTDIGYKIIFKKKKEIQPYISIGASYISATLRDKEFVPTKPSTQPSALTVGETNNTMSFNATAGVVYWLKESKVGLCLDLDLRIVDNEHMVPHNRTALGVKYKL